MSVLALQTRTNPRGGRGVPQREPEPREQRRAAFVVAAEYDPAVAVCAPSPGAGPGRLSELRYCDEKHHQTGRCVRSHGRAVARRWAR